MMTRVITRVIFAAVALFFVLGAVTFGHIAAWYELRLALDQSPLAIAGILGGVDVVFAIALLLLASRSGPSRVEIDAIAIRRQALQGLGSALSLTQLALVLLRIVADARRRRR
jgi:hypothetical protein